jgi:hypothetical protein
VIWGRGKAEYFFKDDWTGQISLNRFNKLGFWRMGATGFSRLQPMSRRCDPPHGRDLRRPNAV